jgi:toxin ParE1/3/4
MVRIIIASRVRADLAGISRYSAMHWGHDRAERYLRDIWSMFEKLAKDPRLGRPFSNRRPDHFKVPVGSHAVIYRVRNDEIAIVRVLHQRMNLPQHF